MALGFGKSIRELSVISSSVQIGAQRFPNGDTPIVANGRNNLTALSTELNLYFAAEFNEIRVYRPWFPTQHLSDLLFKWTLPVSSPGLPGYIDRRHPHAVNALLVDKLGEEEVLVCACDDGDVLLYYTKPLQAILDALAEDPNHECWLRPLVVQNVGRSAWGLAVHRNARMLAVSCNTHDIMVFAFALTDDSILYNEPETEWQYPGRSKDTSLTLRCHHSNIPNIAFFNSDLDKEGRYLVSTDLTGQIIVWDLRERNRVTRIPPKASSVHQNPHSGWSVACLDPRSFLLTKTDQEFLGCKAEKNTNGIYDITHSRLNVKDAAIHYPDPMPLDPGTSDARFLDIIRQRVAETGGNLLNVLRAREQSVSEAIEQVNAMEDAANDYEATASSELELAEQPETDEDGDDDMDEDEDAELQDMDFDDDLELGDVTIFTLGDQNDEAIAPGGFTWASRHAGDNTTRNDPVQVRMAESIDSTLFMDSDDDESDHSGPSDEPSDGRDGTLSNNLGQSWNYEYSDTSGVHNGVRRQTNPVQPMPVDPSDVSFLLFHSGQDFVTLQKAPFRDLALISRDPCHQHLPHDMAGLLHQDRLHLTQVIQELNIIIVATATGRAAIYTMTRKISGIKPSEQDEYGLRLDRILPFSSQEKRRERPASPLAGIAVAPIQGHELQIGDVVPNQRWRLLLTYHDHTVLSYELWRDEPAIPLFSV